MRRRIITAVSFGVSQVTEEDTRKGTRGKFVWSGGGDTRIAATPKNTETIVGWRGTEEEMMRGIVPTGTTRANVNKQSGGG